jgi:hypothetical protein
MDTCTLGSTVTPPAARLLIHTEDVIGTSPSWFKAALRRIRALYTHAFTSTAQVPLSVKVIDLQGHCVCVIESVGPLIAIPLPCGTYHVKAQFGEICRNYTLTIEPGKSTDLYLRQTSSLH